MPAEPRTYQNAIELRFWGRYTAASDIFLQEVPKARSWENFLGHLEWWGDKAGDEEVRVAVGGTEEGGTGCRRSHEGHKRGKGNTSLGHFLGSWAGLKV